MSGKKGAANRNKTENPASRHEGKCQVCNHSQRLEIDAAFLDFVSGDEIATEFNVTRDALYRHARYFALSQKRIANTEKVLEVIVERGMSQIGSVPLNQVVDSIKELHKIRGTRQQERPNEYLPDSEREMMKRELRQRLNQVPEVSRANN